MEAPPDGSAKLKAVKPVMAFWCVTRALNISGARRQTEAPPQQSSRPTSASSSEYWALAVQSDAIKIIKIFKSNDPKVQGRQAGERDLHQSCQVLRIEIFYTRYIICPYRPSCRLHSRYSCPYKLSEITNKEQIIENRRTLINALLRK